MKKQYENIIIVFLVLCIATLGAYQFNLLPASVLSFDGSDDVVHTVYGDAFTYSVEEGTTSIDIPYAVDKAPYTTEFSDSYWIVMNPEQISSMSTFPKYTICSGTMINNTDSGTMTINGIPTTQGGYMAQVAYFAKRTNDGATITMNTSYMIIYVVPEGTLPEKTEPVVDEPVDTYNSTTTTPSTTTSSDSTSSGSSSTVTNTTADTEETLTFTATDTDETNYTLIGGVVVALMTLSIVIVGIIYVMKKR